MKNQKYEKIAVDLGIVILMGKIFYQKGREHLPEIKLWWAIDGKPKIKGFLKTLVPQRNSIFVTVQSSMKFRDEETPPPPADGGCPP